jgi:ferredoxin
MRIAIDHSSCDLHGLCAQAAPELFELTDDEVLLLDAEPDEKFRPMAEQAAADCPKAAISVGD